jgi:prepilin-type N-terminal cleavage/methylation domain-containing protein/prepilin-type processing-associated H-X9-DG protein
LKIDLALFGKVCFFFYTLSFKSLGGRVLIYPSYKKQGFTLMELLVVIAIIAMLLAILLPSLSKVKEIARATVCQSNMRQMSVTVTIYGNEHEGRVPPCRPGHPISGPDHPWSDQHAVEWYYLLLETAGQFNADNYDEVYNDQSFKFESFAHCPTWKPAEESDAWDWGYGMNTQLLYYDKRDIRQLDPSGTYRLPNTNFLKSPRIRDIPQPSEMAYCGDSPHYWFQMSAMSWMTNKDEFLEALEDPDYPRPASQNFKWNDRQLAWSVSDPYRHGGSGNYAFIDGHAERLKADRNTYEFFKKRWDKMD